jgi:hypothetical protein
MHREVGPAPSAGRGARHGTGARAAGVALCLAALLAGCGSSEAGEHSKAGIEAAGRDMVANLEAGRYKRACQDLTSASRARIAILPMGGCTGALAFARGFLAVEGRTRLGQVFDQRLHQLLPRLTIEGDRANAAGNVEAVYEDGRWRFEATRLAAEEQHSRLRADIQHAVSQLEKDGAGALLVQAEGKG